MLSVTKAKSVTLEEITQELVHGDGEVRLAGIGILRVVETKERMGRNPRTGEPLSQPAGKRLTFKGSTTIKRQLNGQEAA